MAGKAQALVISLYVPWILSVLFQGQPVTSYWIAWGGSFFIFFQTWFSPARFVLPDLPVYRQIMRPIFIQQLIFAGFMCCTSIFYFLDTLGYKYFERVTDYDERLIYDSLNDIAACQRLSLLAHAALVSGIIIIQHKHLYNHLKYIPTPKASKPDWIIKVCIISFLFSIVMQRLPGLFQFSIGLYNVAVFSGAVLFVKGITSKSLKLLTIGGSVFIANAINSTLTGYKEHILVNFIILACLLYPHYRKLVIALSIPGFLFLFYVLPTYASIIRGQAWSGETSVEQARSEAFETIFSGGELEVEDTNWAFLTNRLSEISMFTQFLNSTPKHIPYYGFEIAENSVMVIMPRVLWPGKPITESLAMQRVYEAGVIDEESTASAKTRPVVDGYLSGGALGVFIYMLLIGIVSQALCNTAENYLGGYETGCVIFYNGFFQFLWRGDTMEFLLNSTFWSLVSMFILFFALRWMDYIRKV